jgi:hypothetical protein
MSEAQSETSSNDTMFKELQEKVGISFRETYNIPTILNSKMEGIVKRSISYNSLGDTLFMTEVKADGTYGIAPHRHSGNGIKRLLPFTATQLALLFIGPSGCAKTAIVSQLTGTKICLPIKVISEKQYRELEDKSKVQAMQWGQNLYYMETKDFTIKMYGVYMDHMNFSDRQGIPELKDGYFEYVPPKKVKQIIDAAGEDDESVVILFFDELMAAEFNLNFIMSTLQEKTWGDITLPHNVFIVCATNPWFVGNYNMMDPGDPIMKRLSTYFVISDVNAVLEFLIQKGTHRLIIEYIKTHPVHLEDYSFITDKMESPRIKFQNPYGWEQLSDLVSYSRPASYQDWEDLQADFESLIGSPIAIAFLKWLKSKLTITIKDVFTKKPSELFISAGGSSGFDKQLLISVVQEASRTIIKEGKIKVLSKEYDLNQLTGRVLNIAEFINKRSGISESIDSIIKGEKNAMIESLAKEVIRRRFKMVIKNMTK